MSLIETEHLRDQQGKPLAVGDTVKALRLSSKTGTTFDFHGYICAVRKTYEPGQLEGLVQPFSGRDALWLPGVLIEAPVVIPAVLEGVLAEWHG